MAAGINDKFTQGTNGSRPLPTTLTAIKAIGATSISCGALTGWPTATAVHFIIYNIDTSGNKVAGTQTDWKGIVSGTTITNLSLKAGTDNGYAVGAVVECAPTAYWAKDMADGMLVEHDQDGTHGAITASSVVASGAISAASGTFTSLTVTGTATSQGWTPLGATPNTVTANGNRNYDLVFNSTDLTGTLSPGMKLQLTRTVAAPSQCTSLNGTTQYYSKASPNKLAFTDDFVVSAWIKLSSYPATAGLIASRYNGTSGWNFFVNANGTVQLQGCNGGAGNNSNVASYASVPLNKWVHVAAQLDMSTFTATTTTSYVMFDGLDVPATVTRNGTNPTTLTQAGNLEIGSQNGGLFPFPGKLAQVAIYNAKVPQATIKASMDRTLTGSETSLASAYSFNNSIADLNTTTPNDLTANGAAVATNADSPFANAVAAGLLEYAEVNSVVFSTNTTVNVRVPDTCQIPTTGGISSVSYSTQSNPYGLPVFTNILGMTILGNSFSMASSTRTEINGMRTTVVVPPMRAVKISIEQRSLSGTTNDLISFEIHDGAVSGTTNLIAGSDTSVGGGGGPSLYVETVERPNTSNTATVTKTYIGALTNNTAARTVSVAGELTSTYRRPMFIKVELV